VGLGRCDCCLDCDSGVEIDLIEARQTWNCAMGKTITPFIFCPGSSSRSVFAPCRTRSATRPSSHSAPQRAFRWLPLSRFSLSLDRYLICELLRPFERVAGVLKFTGLAVCEAQDISEQRRDDFGSPTNPKPTVCGVPSLYLRFINLFQLAPKLHGWGTNHQPSLASYLRRP